MYKAGLLFNVFFLHFIQTKIFSHHKQESKEVNISEIKFAKNSNFQKRFSLLLIFLNPSMSRSPVHRPEWTEIAKRKRLNRIIMSASAMTEYRFK